MRVNQKNFDIPKKNHACRRHQISRYVWTVTLTTTKKDKNKQKLTETDINRQKQTAAETDRNWQE